MKKVIEEIYDIEGRNPWSIRRWLKGEGFDGEIIDQAIDEYAEKIASGHRFGYKNEISQLSLAIRSRVKILTESREKTLADNFGEYVFARPLLQTLYRWILKKNGDK